MPLVFTNFTIITYIDKNQKQMTKNKKLVKKIKKRVIKIPGKRRDTGERHFIVGADPDPISGLTPEVI